VLVDYRDKLASGQFASATAAKGDPLVNTCIEWYAENRLAELADSAQAKHDWSGSGLLGRRHGVRRHGRILSRLCRRRGSRSAAERELHDLRAALLAAYREGMIKERPRVWMPKQGAPRST